MIPSLVLYRAAVQSESFVIEENMKMWKYENVKRISVICGGHWMYIFHFCFHFFHFSFFQLFFICYWSWKRRQVRTWARPCRFTKVPKFQELNISGSKYFRNFGNFNRKCENFYLISSILYWKVPEIWWNQWHKTEGGWNLWLHERAGAFWIFNTEFIIFNAKSIIFNTMFPWFILETPVTS